MPGPVQLPAILWAASLRHFLRQPAQLALALVALAAGVATIVAVNIATASSRRAFELSMRAVSGPATQVITGGPRGLDQALYVRLLTRAPLSGDPQPIFAPVIEGYVTVSGRVMQLAGIDPFASAELDGARERALPGNDSPAPGELRSWFLQPGALVLAADTARQLGLRTGERLTIDIGGVRHSGTLIGLIRGHRPGDATLMLTDIAQAQEWLHMSGRLSRIDVRMPRGAAGRAALAELRRELPPDVRLEQAAGHVQETLDMTSAFSTNLTAMSLLALLVSALLIYGAVSFTVVQRRRSRGRPALGRRAAAGRNRARAGARASRAARGRANGQSR